MVATTIRRGISPSELLRAVSSDFDNSVFISDNIPTALSSSSGMPLSIWSKKADLLSRIQLSYPQEFISSTDVLEIENIHLRNENNWLRNVISDIEKRLDAIETTMIEKKIVVINEITKDEAEAIIISLFHSGRTLYYSDISQEIGLDLETVVQICTELQERGVIAPDA